MAFGQTTVEAITYPIYRLKIQMLTICIQIFYITGSNIQFENCRQYLNTKIDSTSKIKFKNHS